MDTEHDSAPADVAVENKTQNKEVLKVILWNMVDVSGWNKTMTEIDVLMYFSIDFDKGARLQSDEERWTDATHGNGVLRLQAGYPVERQSDDL